MKMYDFILMEPWLNFLSFRFCRVMWQNQCSEMKMFSVCHAAVEIQYNFLHSILDKQDEAAKIEQRKVLSHGEICTAE